MRKKLLIVARGGLSFWSNRKLTLTRLSLSRSPKRVSIEINNSIGHSNIQWRGRSYAASVPSDKPNSQKGQKRVSRDERRTMVESFVNKYRAINAGKFPTALVTMKQVGGSFYVIREIIQELEYKSKMNSSNSMDENLVVKKLFNESKLLTSETVKVSSCNTKTAKDRPIQDDFQLGVLDDMEIVDAGYEHLEEKRGSQTTTWERSLSKEAVITSASGSHFIAAQSNLLERDAEEPSQSNLLTSNDVKTEEAVSSCSDSVAPKGHLPIEDIEHVSTSFRENSGTSYGKAQNHDSKFFDMENNLIVEEKCIEKAGNERREQAALEDLSVKPSQSSLQMPNDVETEEAESSSDFAASENHMLKEEIKHLSAPFSEISCSSQSKARESEFVDIENHVVTEKKSIEKAGYERREHDALEDLPGMDGSKHTMEQFQGALEMNESKTDKSNRETSDAEVSKKRSLWENLKSIADDIMNMWRKF